MLTIGMLIIGFCAAIATTACAPHTETIEEKINRLAAKDDLEDADIVFLVETICVEKNSFAGAGARGALGAKASLRRCFRILELRRSLHITNQCLNEELMGVVSSIFQQRGITEFSVPPRIGNLLRLKALDDQELESAWKEWLTSLATQLK